MKQKRLGWRKDPWDKRDFLVKLIPPLELPDIVDLGRYASEVRNQGDCGSCVGFGIGANLTSLANMQAFILPGEIQYISPTDIYNGARYIEGTLPYDEGCYPRNALDWLLKKGCLPETFWPYNGFEKKSRSSKLDPEAAKYPLLEYYRVDNGVEGICSAMAAGFYVSIGTPWPSKWMNSKDGILPEIKKTDDIAGGHETCLYGYDRNIKRFYGINSWGIDIWSYSGKVVPKGHFTIPFSAFDIFKYQGGYDAHYVKIQWVTPEPPAPPTPVSEVQVKVSIDKGQNWTTYIPS